MENSEITTPAAQDVHCRNESLLQALHKLREEVNRIENNYPGLNYGFTALCDEAIQSVQGKEPLLPCNCEEPLTPCHCEEHRDEAIPPTPDVNEFERSPISVIKKANPLVSALDRTGYYLSVGFDKAGDGIILAFDALLKLGRRSNGR